MAVHLCATWGSLARANAVCLGGGAAALRDGGGCRGPVRAECRVQKKRQAPLSPQLVGPCRPPARAGRLNAANSGGFLFTAPSHAVLPYYLYPRKVTLYELPTCGFNQFEMANRERYAHSLTGGPMHNGNGLPTIFGLSPKGGILCFFIRLGTDGASCRPAA